MGLSFKQKRLDLKWFSALVRAALAFLSLLGLWNFIPVIEIDYRLQSRAFATRNIISATSDDNISAGLANALVFVGLYTSFVILIEVWLGELLEDSKFINARSWAFVDLSSCLDKSLKNSKSSGWEFKFQDQRELLRAFLSFSSILSTTNLTQWRNCHTNPKH
jgi:hypothetical protein